MTKARIRNSPEAKRWLIVGAFQAGATEKHVARISGLSRTAVRNIILNYQRTGTPCIPKKIPNKIRQKLVVEYDENGNIINTDDEEEEEQEEAEEDEEIEPRIVNNNSTMFKKKKKINIKKRKSAIAATTTSNSSTTGANVTTKDIINYAMDQMRITDNNHIHISASAQKLIEKEQQQTEQNYHHYHSQAESSSNSSDNSIYIPPPQQQQQITESSSNNNNTSLWHNLLSPPHHYNTVNQEQAVQPAKSKKRKSTTGARIPPPSKFDQNIRGYELWTHDDDMILLNHVLHHLHGGGWNELEVRFNGRHSARLCYDRWKHLKSLLLKGITDKPNTPW